MPNKHTNRFCSVTDCDRTHHAKGFCMWHYDRTPERIAAKAVHDQRKNARKKHLRRMANVKRGRPKGTSLSIDDKRERTRLAVKAWRHNNPDKAKLLSRLHKHARRARVANARVVGRINKKDIENWESRICGICKLSIKGEFHIDHKIPLAKGGLHVASNLQLAHPFCNRSKFTKLPEEMSVVL